MKTVIDTIKEVSLVAPVPLPSSAAVKVTFYIPALAYPGVQANAYLLI
ncbi:hypothetical protein [Nostoc sp.]